MAFSRRRIRRFGRIQRVVRAPATKAVRYHYVSHAGTFPITGGSQILGSTAHVLNGVSRGTGITARDSNRIRGLSLDIRGGFIFNPFRNIASSLQQAYNEPEGNPGFWRSSQECSIIIAWSPVTNSALPQLTNYYALTPGVSVVDTWSLPLSTEYPILKILYRRDFAFTTQAVAACAAGASSTTAITSDAPGNVIHAARTGIRQVKISLRVPMVTVFNDTSSAPVIADIASGTLIMYVLGDYPSYVPGNPQHLNRPQLNFESRYSFVDLD